MGTEKDDLTCLSGLDGVGCDGIDRTHLHRVSGVFPAAVPAYDRAAIICRTKRQAHRCAEQARA